MPDLMKYLENHPEVVAEMKCYRCDKLIGDAEYRVVYNGCVRHYGDCPTACQVALLKAIEALECDADCAAGKHTKTCAYNAALKAVLHA